ncbi:MAG: fatty acid desaturase [Saprospiraceae bacterium]|nr:fatty acid desaturase [Saprospiraceae bacterium]MCB9325422.1 fatty acid desaturase [Lewinellaceae bacterium]
MSNTNLAKEVSPLTISLGNEKISFVPETKKAIDIELMLLHIPLLATIAAFSLDYIGWPVFLLLFYVIAMRIFIGNHDRYHASHKARLPRFLEAFSEGLAVVVTPWDEPYDSIRRKHLKHHTTHNPGNSSSLDSHHDPHSVYELGGIVRVFFSCLFYEEIQFYFDLRDKQVTRSRLYRFLIYMPILAIYIFTFGWAKFGVIFLAMRIVGFTAWFVFSWAIHQPLIYKFGFSKQVPTWFKWMFAIMHGRRVTEGCIHHATHHAWPSIPFNQLHKFDVKAYQNPDVAPEMNPIG